MFAKQLFSRIGTHTPLAHANGVFFCRNRKRPARAYHQARTFLLDSILFLCKNKPCGNAANERRSMLFTHLLHLDEIAHDHSAMAS